MAKKKGKPETYVATFEGREFEVPRGLMGSELRNYIQTQLAIEKAEAATADARKQEEQSEIERLRIEMAQLKSAMAEQVQRRHRSCG